MDEIVSVSGHVGADIKTKQTDGKVTFAYFPFYVKYTNVLDKPKKADFKVQVALTEKLALKYHTAIEKGDELQIQGRIVNKPYVDKDGVTKDWNNLHAISIEFL